MKKKYSESKLDVVSQDSFRISILKITVVVFKLFNMPYNILSKNTNWKTPHLLK